MCNALATLGLQVTLFAKRSIVDDAALLPTLREVYAVELPDVRMVTFHSGKSRGDSLRIAMLALAELWRKGMPDLIISRNLYASFVIAVILRSPIVFETHQVEFRFRKRLQRAIMRQQHVLTLVISKRLVLALQKRLGLTPARTLVLHDAAPAGIDPISKEARRALRDEWAVTLGKSLPEFVCGYFGHLYPGRGIEIIEEIARARPTVAFLVFGGNEADIIARTKTNNLPNLHYMGFLNHARVRDAMASMDLLLMPYQAEVSIGVAGHDTAEWMSPMKMFEYMASNVPFLASRLPALQEVLVDEVNCLLAEPAEAADWIACLDRLMTKPVERAALANKAYAEYQQQYNWVSRANKILEAYRP